MASNNHPTQQDQQNFNRTVLLSPPNPVLQRIDYACCLFFTVELFLRFTFCPSKKAFFKSWLTWIDILSVIACINDFLINMFYKTEKYKSSPVDAVFLIRVVRIIRVFRYVLFLQNVRDTFPLFGIKTPVNDTKGGFSGQKM